MHCQIRRGNTAGRIEKKKNMFSLIPYLHLTLLLLWAIFKLKRAYVVAGRTCSDSAIAKVIIQMKLLTGKSDKSLSPH